jgi:hypothetical protein
VLFHLTQGNGYAPIALVSTTNVLAATLLCRPVVSPSDAGPPEHDGVTQSALVLPLS